MPFFNQNAYIRATESEIYLEEEKKIPLFRFKDFTEEAQAKFARCLKSDSSIWTIKQKAKERDVLTVLKDLNPIIIHSDGSWSHSTFFRWRERALSSIVYNSLFMRTPRRLSNWVAGYMLESPYSIRTEAGRRRQRALSEERYANRQ